MLSEPDWKLVRHAADIAAELGECDEHSVVAAAYDAAGDLVTGVNAHHFTGGPCAELVLLGRAAEHRAPVRLSSIVAVRAPSGSVLPPCGRCRQVLFDYHPATRAVVRGKNGLEAVAMPELLPFTYDWRAAEPDAPAPALYLYEGYLPAVRAGTKRSTIRVHDPFSAGPVRLVFDHEDGSATTLPATVSQVRTTLVRELTDEDARTDGFADRAALAEALSRHYPGLSASTEADIVYFRLDSD